MSPPDPIPQLSPPAGGTTGDILYALAKRQFIYGGFINEPVAMDIDLNGDGTCSDWMVVDTTRRVHHQNTIYSPMGVAPLAVGERVASGSGRKRIRSNVPLILVSQARRVVNVDS